jgi:hypothetical protein
MRAELTAGLQELWAESLRQRAELTPTSEIRTLDQSLEPQRELGAEAATVNVSGPKPRRLRLETRYLDREAGR